MKKIFIKKNMWSQAFGWWNVDFSSPLRGRAGIVKSLNLTTKSSVWLQEVLDNCQVAEITLHLKNKRSCDSMASVQKSHRARAVVNLNLPSQSIFRPKLVKHGKASGKWSSKDMAQEPQQSSPQQKLYYWWKDNAPIHLQ